MEFAAHKSEDKDDDDAPSSESLPRRPLNAAELHGGSTHTQEALAERILQLMHEQERAEREHDHEHKEDEDDDDDEEEDAPVTPPAAEEAAEDAHEHPALVHIPAIAEVQPQAEPEAEGELMIREPAEDVPMIVEEALATQEETAPINFAAEGIHAVPLAHAAEVAPVSVQENAPEEPAPATHAGGGEPITVLPPSMGGGALRPPAAPRIEQQPDVWAIERNAEAAGRARGLVVGGLIGYAVGRHGGTKRLNRYRAEASQQLQGQQERISQLETQHAETQRKLANLERQPAGALSAPLESAPSGQFVAPTERLDQPRPVAIPEQRTAKPAAPVEQAPEENGAQSSESQEEHHIEHSTWHSIEVDTKTGRAVEQPSQITYGEAMRAEQQPEKMVPVSADNTQSSHANDQQQAMLGGLGVGLAGAVPPAGSSAPSLSSPQDAAKHATDSTSKQVVANLTNPGFWMLIGILLVVFIIVAVFL